MKLFNIYDNWVFNDSLKQQKLPNVIFLDKSKRLKCWQILKVILGTRLTWKVYAPQRLCIGQNKPTLSLIYLK